MSERLVECVPNFSEGRDRAKIDAIVAAAREVEGCSVLDVDPGRETNRTVVTLLGAPGPIAEAAFRCIERAAQLIDMTKHEGAHPRHGATDVCPFIPVAGVTMDECAQIAREVGKRVGEQLGIPVYLYEHAASRPERRSLAKVRAGEYEALPEKLAKPEWKPDYGPAKFLPKTGVVTIGAREFLIAWNVNLNTARKEAADELAGEIRETGRALRRGQTDAWYSSGALVKYRPSKGQFPCAECETTARSFAELEAHTRKAHDRDLRAELAFFDRDPEALEGVNVMKRGLFDECRAVGWVIPEYGRAQISVNLTNYKVTPPHAVYDAVRRLAAERGLVVTGSEVVGLIPYDAIRQAGEHYLALQGASTALPARDVVEIGVQSLGLRDVGAFDIDKRVLGLPQRKGPLIRLDSGALADEVSRPTPAPGGGSLAALAGALGASLAAMVGNLSHAKKGFEERRDELAAAAGQCQALKERLLAAVDADTEAFNEVIAAMRLPKGTAAEKAAREAAIQAGTKLAAEVPLATADDCLSALRLCRTMAERGNPASITDAGVGALLAWSGVQGALDNVAINLGSITDAAWVAEMRGTLAGRRSDADRLLAETRGLVDAALAG